MARVTQAEVLEIIEVGPTITDLSSFINTATVLVDATLLEAGYSAALLKEIELYLSAHYTALRQRQLKQKKMGDSTESYLGAEGKGLEFTQYGQNAIDLDMNGILTNLGKPSSSLQVITVCC